MNTRLTGLFAAVYTPMHADGSLNLDQVGPIVDCHAAAGVSGIYVCGSTGEGMSLTGDERRAVAEAYTEAAHFGDRMTVVVQVGHNSLAEAQQLAAHAQQIGANVISATCPSYFKVNDVDGLIDCMAEVAGGAPELPFYYYHIPALTGSPIAMTGFLPAAAARIPNLVGMKYTTPMAHEYQACLELNDGEFDCLWGCDEMMLAGLGVGARGFIGSTYNVAAGLYLDLIEAFDRGDLDEARRLQSLSVNMIRTINGWPFHPGMKQILKMLGFECGQCRLPHKPLSARDVSDLREALESIGFFDWRGGKRMESVIESN